MKVPHWARNFLRKTIDLSTFSPTAVKELVEEDMTAIRVSSYEEWCATIDLISASTGCHTPSERLSLHSKNAWNIYDCITYDPLQNMLLLWGICIPGIKVYSYEEFENLCLIKYQNLEPSVDCLL